MATKKNINRSRSSKQETGFEKLMNEKIVILDRNEDEITGTLIAVYPNFIKLGNAEANKFDGSKTRLVAISYIGSVSKC